MALIILSNNCPAAPTKGRPVASSSAPGPSPINISLALAEPSPKTTFWRDPHKAQFRQFNAILRKPSQSPGISSTCGIRKEGASAAIAVTGGAVGCGTGPGASAERTGAGGGVKSCRAAGTASTGRLMRPVNFCHSSGDTLIPRLAPSAAMAAVKSSKKSI